MKNIAYVAGSIFLIISLNACNDNFSKNRQHFQSFTLKALGIQILLPSSAEIITIPIETSAFTQGKSIIVSSMSSDEFTQKVLTKDIDSYFDFIIYKPQKMTTTEQEEFIKMRCDNSGTINRQKKNMKENYVAIELSSRCFPLRTYGIRKNGFFYLIESGQDTRNFDGVWNAINSIHFL